MTDRVIFVCTILVAAVYFYATTLIPSLEIGDESFLEVVPPAALSEAAAWADYLARDSDLGSLKDLPGLRCGEALVQTPLPCGGMADCGACVVHLKRGYLLACKDGPVVDLKRLTVGHA